MLANSDSDDRTLDSNIPGATAWDFPAASGIHGTRLPCILLPGALLVELDATLDTPQPWCGNALRGISIAAAVTSCLGTRTNCGVGDPTRVCRQLAIMAGDEPMAPLVVTSTSLVGIIWVLMVLGIRLYIRIKLNGPLSNDDHAAIFATILGIAQSSLVLVGVQSGLGRSSELQDEGHRQRTMKVGISIPRFLCRPRSLMSHLLAASAALLLSILGGLACILTIAFQCKIPRPWDGEECIDLWPLWCGIEITAIALEIFIFSISLLLVWSLRMRFKLKAMVVFAFSVRLLVIIPLVLRLIYIHNSHLTSESIYTSIAVTTTTTITTHIAIMACTLPCLKQFLAMFESGMIGEYSDATYTGSGKGTRTDGSIALTSLTSDGKARRRPVGDFQLRPDRVVNDSVAEVCTDANSTRSDRSSAAIIKKTQQWEVKYERW
ncbi:hypothetical protein Q7P37_008521 [Cladosporium fusiforme]